MRKLTLVAALVAASLTLGGCSTKDVTQWIANASLFVKTSLQKGRDGIRTYCSSIASADNEARAMAIAAATGSCKAVARVQFVITTNAAICNNVDLLTDSEVGNYSRSIASAFKEAQAALKNGC